VIIDGKSQRIEIKAILTDYQQERLISKFGSLRITQKSRKQCGNHSIRKTFWHTPDGKNKL
jgi:hypothetical protein